MRLWASILAAATLIVGFGVAVLTGNRTLGGVVLIAGGIVCAWMWWRLSGPWRTLACVAIAGIAFVVSHPLGHVITAWGSVFLVSAITAGTTYAICSPTKAVDSPPA